MIINSSPSILQASIGVTENKVTKAADVLTVYFHNPGHDGFLFST